MRYGHFDDERREYVITRPDTPLPWINYLCGGEYVAIVSNTGGGYSYHRDARLRRLTRFRYNNAPLDLGARFLYLRDDDSGEAWSPTWGPIRSDLEDYECRHGFGYTIVGSRRAAVRAEVTFIVPLGETLELWRVRLTNERPTPSRLSLFGAAEFCLWDAEDDATNYQRNWSIGEVEVEDGVIYHKTEYRERRDHFAFFACSDRPAGFETVRDAFLGPYRGWDRPIGVERGHLGDSVALGWQPIAAQQCRLTLEPGASAEITFALGYAENPRMAKFDPPGSQTIDKRRVRAVLARVLAPGSVGRALASLRAQWAATLDTLQVRTPDEDLDRMVNAWNAYQCLTTLEVSRSASLFESGIGRGMGFRDSAQDLLGFVPFVPERARLRLLDLAATQLPDGGAWHQYQPLTKRGNDAVGSGFNDDPLWLVLAATAYLRETGDFGVLEERVPFDNIADSEAPLLEHLRRAIGYTVARTGPHGLPLIGRADWNDCLNLNTFSDEPGESFQTTALREGGAAESVLIAGMFVLAATELADVVDALGDRAAAARLRALAGEMVAAADAHAWDGAWFRRAYDHAGRPVGSADNDEGRIFAEPQGICVMAGIGLADGRAAQALDSVRERLATAHGVALLQPAYTRYQVHLGEITSYPPGFKENASVFCHTNPWLMIAEARLGRADAALDYYLRINPSARESISDVHRCEPYVYAQMIAGPDASTHGEAKNSWLTGTAAWAYVAATQWILGVRPELGGLRIDPCLPAAWDGAEVTRRFRGTTYRIVIGKPPGTTGRVRRLVVDGSPIEGTLVPPSAGTGGSVTVEAWVEPLREGPPADATAKALEAASTGSEGSPASAV